MTFGLKVLWSLFIAAVVAMAIIHWREDEPDGGGACAMIGFSILIVLVVGTLLERRELRAIRCDEDQKDDAS